MLRFALLLPCLGLSLVPISDSASAAPRDVTAAAGVDVSAQSRRPPARIRVTPRLRSGVGNSPYPRPYNVEYPGPNARRDCAVRYVQEPRPSGLVIVPRMNCWWVRG